MAQTNSLCYKKEILYIRNGITKAPEIRLQYLEKDFYMSLGLEYYLVLSALLFTIGVIGVLIRRNAIIIFMCIELMLNAANLAFVAISRDLGQVEGQLFVFFVMAVAAAEVAIGLAIIVSVFKHRETINVDEVNSLKG